MIGTDIDLYNIYYKSLKGSVMFFNHKANTGTLSRQVQRFFIPTILLFIIITGCNQKMGNHIAKGNGCNLVESGYGPEGRVEIKTETVVTGLEVPWAIAFLPDGDALVTERPGRLRLVKDIYNNAQLTPQPVITVQTATTAEGGLLGITLHPDFENNRLFYMYVTTFEGNETYNKVERYRLSENNSSAQSDRIIYREISAARIHDGGRIHFGPDGMLYIGTGDASKSGRSQEPENPNGKLLRLTPEGEIPGDNPVNGSAAWLTGIRNTQGFDWPGDASVVWLVDHGPSGERLRFGHDEVNVARAGDNLGWPPIYGCEIQGDMIPPVLTWEKSVPPGGAAIYTSNAIPEWEGNLIIGTLRSRHLHRVVIENNNLVSHEVYLQDEYGRLRDVIMGNDGELYITTSNCDGRGTCPDEGDKILRITR